LHYLDIFGPHAWPVAHGMQVVVYNDQFIEAARKITTTGSPNDRALRGRQRSA
jgi:hypothetical protein